MMRWVMWLHWAEFRNRHIFHVWEGGALVVWKDHRRISLLSIHDNPKRDTEILAGGMNDMRSQGTDTMVFGPNHQFPWRS